MPLDRAGKKATLEIPAASVVTFLVDGVSGVAEDSPAVKDGHTYQVAGEASGKYLTARADSSASIQDLGANAAEIAPQLWTFNAVNADEEHANDRRFVLSNKDGQVLTGNGGILNASQSGSARLVRMSVAEAKAQPVAQWIVTTENGKQWTLVNAAAAIALQVSGAQTAAGSAVALASSTGSTGTATSNTHQTWAFEDIADLVLVGTKRTELSTPIGVVPSLPGTVVPLYEKGPGLPVAVQWDNVDPAVWNKRGTVTLTGSGTDRYGQTFDDAELVVTVGRYVGTDPVSVTVGVGSSPAEVQAAAPSEVPGQIGTGTARNSLAVTWDWSGVDRAALQPGGTVTVPGAAVTGVDGGKPLKATLTVLVVERVASSHICKDDASTAVAASYTEGSYAAKNTCDGSTTTRWSNWVSGGRSGDTLSYSFTRDYTVDSVTVTLAEKPAHSLTVQYQDAQGAWQETSAGVVAGLTTTAPVKVAIDPVTTRGIRVSLATPGSYTKVGEVAVSGSRLADAALADLGRLLVDQKPVPGFEAGSGQDGLEEYEEYKVLTASTAVPTVSGYALDTNAKVSVAQDAAGQPVAVVTVTAPNGKAREYRVTFVTGKQECQNGGWTANVEPGFSSEGECVSYFATKQP